MKKEQWEIVAKLVEESIHRPSSRDYAEEFKRQFPQEVALHGDAAVMRLLVKGFNDFARSKTGIDPDAPKEERQLDLALPGEPPSTYCLPNGSNGSFEVVRYDRATRADLESAIAYKSRLVGHINHNIRDERLKLNYLLSFPGFAAGELTVGEALKRPETELG